MFFSGNEVTETAYVPRANNPREADPVSKLAPRFDASDVSGALKYDTEADARAMCEHPDLADPQAFAGCEIVEE